jgi:colanic acid/amylovoran biosynthesis protein
VDFIDWVVGEFGFNVVLIPHVVDARPTAKLDRNDHLFLSQIAQRARNRDRVVLADAFLRAGEMKYLISRCRFFIGSRTHSTISALSSGVPTISLSYSMKSRGINQDVLGNQDFLLPVDGLSLERLQHMFRQVMAREEEIKATLRNRIPAVKDMARKNAKCLGELLGVDVPEKGGEGREA